jgi:hypothetical protein
MASRRRLSEYEDLEIRANIDSESESDLEMNLNLRILMSLRIRTPLELIVLLQDMAYLLETENGSRAIFHHPCIPSTLRNQE